MAYHSSVLSQLLKLLPRHEFEKQANGCDGQRRSDALSRWSQFVALSIGQLGGRRSLRDIEATLRSQGRHRYHLGSQSISRSALSRANEQLDYRFYEDLFQSLYQRCTSNRRSHVPLQEQAFFSGCLTDRCVDESVSMGQLRAPEVGLQVTPWAGP